MFELDASFISSIIQVVIIDLVLAGDNAVVVGLTAAGLPPDLRRRAIMIGILSAALLRVCFALVTTELLLLGGGLLIAGGLLLLWVCWKMYRELTLPDMEQAGAAGELAGQDINADGTMTGRSPGKSLRQAVPQIIIADISMSLDNVLAVAGAAKEHLGALVFGLGLSVVMMGLAATLVARVLQRYKWIAWIGVAVVLFVALRMMLEGAGDFIHIPGVPLLDGPHHG